jgi:hypothetical protein
MEPKGSRKRVANQLQSAVVQNQTVQSGSPATAIHSGPARKGLSPAQSASLPEQSEGHSTCSEKVVVQFGNRTIKGYLDTPAWETVEELLGHAPHTSPESFRVRLLDSNIVEEIPAQNVKAVFYVNSFDGDSDHEILNFHSRAPIIHGIWMRLQFVDGEVMEGIVYNSLRYLIDPGFFLLPTDPDSNNKVVYVRKNRLVDLRVLGMRKL